MPDHALHEAHVGLSISGGGLRGGSNASAGNCYGGGDQKGKRFHVSGPERTRTRTGCKRTCKVVVSFPDPVPQCAQSPNGRGRPTWHRRARRAWPACQHPLRKDRKSVV